MEGQNENYETLKMELQQAREASAILHENWASALKSKRGLIRSAIDKGIDTSIATELFDTWIKNSREEYVKTFESMCELSDRYAEAISLSKDGGK